MKIDEGVWLCLWILLSMGTRSESVNNTCDTFYLLNLYPAPDESNSTGFDKGLELIPAGHLATQHINSDSSVLPGHRIELIDVPTEACEQTIIIEGLTNYYEQVLNPNGVCIYGIVGLYCSTVTNVIAPIASHPNIGYVQLAASTSPAHRNVTRFPYTFHTLSSTRVLNRAVVKLMEEFNWKRVISVFNSLSIYHRSTAINFKKLLIKQVDATLTSIALVSSLQTATIFDILVDQETRIVYISATDTELAAFFCEAHKRQFLWPNYAYIIVENSIPGVVNHSSDCSAQDLSIALEGTFSLRYRLQNYAGQYLDISRRMYEQYHDEYIEVLNRFAQKMNVTLKANPYADTLYDQVWAIALALNTSLNNFSHSSNLKDKALIRATLAANLKKVDFIGASGTVRFGENEIFTPVEIYQIRNRKEVLIGTYDSFNSVIRFNDTFNRSIVPDDKFEPQVLFAPLWMGIVVIIASITILSLTVFNTAATIFLKKKPELKSGSVPLSLVILLASCILSTSPVCATVLVTTVPLHPNFFCNLKFWTFIVGIVLIFSTLFWRLLRTFHVFRSFRRTGKRWSDRYLILYITLTCSIAFAILTTWAVLDPLHYTEDVQYTSVNSSPGYVATFSCSCNHLAIWMALIFGFIGCIMILLVFFAIQTRHIHIKHFKDTKKTNIFIFSVCIIYAIFIPLWLILSELGIPWFAYLCQSIATLAGAALCQVLLLLPKTIPAIYNCAKS